MLTDFQNFCTVGKRMKFATKLYDITHLTLRMLLHYLGKLKMQFLHIFSTYGRKCKQIAFLSPLPLLFIHIFQYFQCLK